MSDIDISGNNPSEEKKPVKAAPAKRKKSAPVKLAEVDAASVEKRSAHRTSRAEKRMLAKRRRQRNVMLCLLAVVLVLFGLCGWRFIEYNNFQAMRAAVEIETFYEGTFIDDIDISNMTLAQAQAHWTDKIEPTYYNHAVSLSDGTQVTAAMVGYQSNYLDVLQAAYEIGRSGGIADRYSEVSKVEDGLYYAVTRSLYTQEGIDAYVASYAQSVNTEPMAPVMTNFSLASYEFTYSDPEPGKKLNEEALSTDLLDAFENGRTSVTLDIEEIPAVAGEKEYGIISYCITDASSSSTARLHNLETALTTINGTCLQPGETFSFNEVVGPRTKKTGYRKAKAYYGMTDIMEYGGGICQASSTLYSSVLDAKFDIVERHEHSRKVYYIPKGRDATVDWGHKDLKFTNNRDEPVYICCVMQENEKIRIGIFGKLQDGDVDLTKAE